MSEVAFSEIAVSEVEIRREGDSAVVVAKGDVLSSSVPRIQTVLRDLVRSGVRDLVFDMECTSMIDSTGLGLLLAAFNSLKPLGGRFSVIHVSEDILHLFRSMRINQHFAVSGR